MIFVKIVRCVTVISLDTGLHREGVFCVHIYLCPTHEYLCSLWWLRCYINLTALYCLTLLISAIGVVNWHQTMLTGHSSLLSTLSCPTGYVGAEGASFDLYSWTAIEEAVTVSGQAF